MNPELEAEVTELVLERLTMAGQVTMPARLIEQAKVRVFPILADELVAQLYTYVHAERVLDDDATVYFSGEAWADVPRNWLMRKLRRPPHRVRVDVSGDVTVPATYWRVFPDSTIAWPDSLGAPVRQVQLGTPTFEADE